MKVGTGNIRLYTIIPYTIIQYILYKNHQTHRENFSSFQKNFPFYAIGLVSIQLTAIIHEDDSWVHAAACTDWLDGFQLNRVNHFLNVSGNGHN